MPDARPSVNRYWKNDNRLQNAKQSCQPDSELSPPSAPSRAIRQLAPKRGRAEAGPMAWLGASSAKAASRAVSRPLARPSPRSAPCAALSTTCLSRSRRRR